MGAYWLHDVLKPLQSEFGSKLYLLGGYELRSRSTGGFDRISGIVNHHDADPPSGSDINAVNYCYFNAADRPIGNFHIVRNGDVYWGAAGASNHAGRGGAVSTSKGTVPLDAGNKYLIGIEASNSGVGESWPDVQLDSIIRLDVVLCKTFGLNPLTDIFTHAGWCEPSCPGRKVDPAGPTPKYPKFGGTSGANTWNLGELRKEVNARMQATLPVPPVEPPDTTKPQGIAKMGKPLVLRYGGTPTSNWSGYFSYDGVSKHGVRGMHHAAQLVALGAIDAKTLRPVVYANWSDVTHTTNLAELDEWLTPGAD